MILEGFGKDLQGIFVTLVPSRVLLGTLCQSNYSTPSGKSQISFEGFGRISGGGYYMCFRIFQ